MRTLGLQLTIIAASSTFALAGGSSTLTLDRFDEFDNQDAAGHRTPGLQIFTGSPHGTARFTLQPNANNGAIAFSSDGGVAAQASLTYNRFGAGLDFDTTMLGLTAIRLNYRFVDQDFNMHLTLRDGSGSSSTTNKLVSQTGFDFGFVIFELDEFNLDGLDVRDIDEMMFTFNTPVAGNPRVPGLDFVITSLTASVPAPGAACLIASIGLIGARRRR